MKQGVVCSFCYELFLLDNAWDYLGKEVTCSSCNKTGIVEYTNEEDDDNLFDFVLVKGI
jgi:hypothetical protein